MKKILFITSLLISVLTFAQVPQGISYQAIALNGSGNPVVSSNVGLRLSILDNSSSGTVLYTETHTKTTNAQGLFNTIIGQGTPTTGTFSTINWGTNSKFLKVELDATGGTNYTLVGTTQLLSVPYAMTSATIKTTPGQGITLTSPNGSPYILSVNDSGQLSLPTSGNTSTNPSTLYMYGSFNSFNESSSLLMNPEITYTSYQTYNFSGYKYLTSGTQLKFLSQNNSSSPIYGLNGSLDLIQNGSSYTIPSNGFYFINFYRLYNENIYHFQAQSISPILVKNIYGSSTDINPTYNSGTNTFSFTLNGLTSSNFAYFKFLIPKNDTSFPDGNFGDNLNDGTIDYNGTYITIPNLTSTPKNFRVDLILNFNGSGTYTITQI